MRQELGCVQIYTGNGKGKTTAAIGQAIRAWSAGMEVRIVQFMKPFGCSAEQKTLAGLGAGLKIACFGVPGFCKADVPPDPEQLAAAAAAKKQAADWLTAGCDLMVLDEINNAVHFGLIQVAEVLALLDQRPPKTELVLTGRHLAPPVAAKADLITEMRQLKHYADAGMPARPGIEY